MLPYDRAVVPQETGYWCGPASTQVVLNSRGIRIDESELARQTELIENPGGWDDRDGTDHIGQIATVLNRHLPDADYTVVEMHNDPPTNSQKVRLWTDIMGSINAGYGVVMNWVAPPGNKPRGVKGSVSPTYSGGTTYHYVTAMGYDIAEKAVWIADSGFRPFGYWISLDQCASLIPPKGYAYAKAHAQSAPVPTPEPSTKDRYALAIIAEGRRARHGEGQLDHPVISERGIKIALATVLVETNLTMYANHSDPGSLDFPHEKVGSDHNSSGLFQQRPPWWGTVADRMDPARSAALFYNALAKRDYTRNDLSPGNVAQSVQQSAFPERYDQRWPEAVAIYDRLSDQVQTPSTVEELLMSDKLYPSLSIYKTPGSGAVHTLASFIQAMDARAHEDHIEKRARQGDAAALALIARTAAGKGEFTDPASISQAEAVLASIGGKTIEEVRDLLGKG